MLVIIHRNQADYLVFLNDHYEVIRIRSEMYNYLVLPTWNSRLAYAFTYVFLELKVSVRFSLQWQVCTFPMR